MRGINNSAAASGSVLHASLCVVFPSVSLSLWPHDPTNLSQEREAVRESESEPLWIKSPTSKWDVRGEEEVGVMSLMSCKLIKKPKNQKPNPLIVLLRQR